MQLIDHFFLSSHVFLFMPGEKFNPSFFFQFQEIFCYFNLFYCFTLLLTLCVIGFICDIYFGSILYVYILSAVCLQFAETWQDLSRKNVRRPRPETNISPYNSLRSLKKSSKTRTLMTSYPLSVQVIKKHALIQQDQFMLVMDQILKF